MQTKIIIPDDIYEKIKIAADKNYRTINQEINFRLNNSFNNPFATQPHEIAGIPFPAFPMPDYSHVTSSAAVPPQSFADVNTTVNAHSNITPPGVQPTVATDPNANTIDIKPGILPNPLKDYRQPESEQKNVIAGPGVEDTPVKSRSYKNNIQPTLTDIEIEQVDNEWDSEGNEYSTEDFMVDLRNLEEKLREDVPADQDPTQDPDYIAIKKYFIKHDLRERFRSLLSDPSRFYPEEGVYDPPQIRYIRAAFRKEKIDEDYIVALLSGTGADYRRTHKSRLYVDEQ